MQARNFADGAAVVDVDPAGAVVAVVVVEVLLLPQAAKLIATAPRTAAALNPLLMDIPLCSRRC
jgi:hypothetical protein